MPVELEVGGVTDHQPLQPPRLRVQGRQAHQLALDLFPVRQRIDEQALVARSTVATRRPWLRSSDVLAVPGRHGQPALVASRVTLLCTAKHVDAAG